MATVESLKKYVKDVMAKRGNIPDYKPIYAIMLFENPDKIQYDEENGKPTKFWFPELGRTGGPGYYHDLESAVKAMHENAGDIRETIFNAGFVIAKFPGLYNTMGPEGRIYFLWDEEKQGFFEAEEPKTFSLFGY